MHTKSKNRNAKHKGSVVIKLLALDVDGTLSDGGIYIDSCLSGALEKVSEMKCFDVKDGLAIASWIRIGGEVAIITGRRSGIVAHRAKELGIKHLFQGVKDKGAILRELCVNLGIKRDFVASIGDDLNDLSMFRESALKFAPSDCAEAIISHVDVHLRKRGGHGAVREMIEYILRRDGRMEEFLALWE